MKRKKQHLTDPLVFAIPMMLSIVIPALNEEDSIKSILERVLAIRADLKVIGINELELIVVDDGSTDQTADIVKDYPDVHLIQHPQNQGYGAALKTGFRSASGKLLGFLDADGTYPPEYLPQLCQSILNGADIVVGSRRSGEATEMPVLRKLGNFIWSNLLTLVVGERVIDPASGMRVFRREILEYIYPLPDGLNFTPVMSTRTAHEHLHLVELPIPYKERQGSSKLNVIKDGIRFLQTILWTALYYNPVRILGGMGAFFFAISSIIALALISLRISGVTVLGPWGVAGTFTAVVISLAGVNLFALGITFNYLVSLFHKRPIHQGLFRRPIFKEPLDRQFWWIGMVLMTGGFCLGLVSFSLALNEWPIERLWLYLLAGTMLMLVGFQLFIFWVIVRVLDELNRREIMVERDLTGDLLNG